MLLTSKLAEAEDLRDAFFGVVLLVLNLIARADDDAGKEALRIASHLNTESVERASKEGAWFLERLLPTYAEVRRIGLQISGDFRDIWTDVETYEDDDDDRAAVASVEKHLPAIEEHVRRQLLLNRDEMVLKGLKFKT